MQGGYFMKSKHCIFLIIFIGVFLTGCGSSSGNHSETAEVNKIKTIYIDHGSDNLLLKSADQPNLEASYSKRDIILDKSGEQITLDVEKSLFNLGPKLNKNAQFKVTIPDDFKGKVVINGSSGNISSDQLSTSNLDIETESGNISLVFDNFHSDVHVVTSSGNVTLILNEEQPDVQLKSKTVSGNNMISIPISENESQDKKVVEGISGKGKFKIDINTISGDIIVR